MASDLVYAPLLESDLPELEPLWAATTVANGRSAGLLVRCGFHPVSPALAPALYSYDEGDLVFTKRAGA